MWTIFRQVVYFFPVFLLIALACLALAANFFRAASCFALAILLLFSAACYVVVFGYYTKDDDGNAHRYLLTGLPGKCARLIRCYQRVDDRDAAC